MPVQSEWWTAGPTRGTSNKHYNTGTTTAVTCFSESDAYIHPRPPCAWFYASICWVYCASWQPCPFCGCPAYQHDCTSVFFSCAQLA